MPDSILKALSENGPWVLMFGILLWVTLKENSKREAGYQQIIKDQGKTLNEIKDDTTAIKGDTKEILIKVAANKT